jgi:prepilin-type N-terminal cleavage/methylation domain-containing protein
MYQLRVLFHMMKQMQLSVVHNKNKGFSLIEMVITVGIIAIIIVALATMGIFTLKKAAESNNKSRALRFSQEAVEAIRYYRDVDKTGFNALTLSYESPSVSAGNYVLQMGAVDVGWSLVTTASKLSPADKNGCQDPVLDNIVKNSTECSQVLEPYFKRKIEVTRVGTDSIDFRITVWWENGNDTGIKGKKVIITTTLAK